MKWLLYRAVFHEVLYIFSTLCIDLLKKTCHKANFINKCLLNNNKFFKRYPRKCTLGCNLNIFHTFKPKKTQKFICIKLDENRFLGLTFVFPSLKILLSTCHAPLNGYVIFTVQFSN